MSKTLRNVGFAALLAISATALMPGQASALSMAECSTKFKAAKAAGTDGGMKWNDFRKAQCGSDAAPSDASAADAPAAQPAPAPKASKATAAKATSTKATTTTAAKAAAPAATTSGSFMQDCSASWKAMKANNTVPAGMAWKDFVAAKCVVAAAPAAPASTGNFMKDCSASWKAMQAANTVPAGLTWKDYVAAKCNVSGTAASAAAPAATPAVAKKSGGLFGKKADVAPPEPADTADATPLATVDKNGKPFTEGQMKAHQRIRACGDQYRTLKASNKLPAQIAALDGKHRWPQFWSLCNEQLKAKGQ